jgi:hypothetical protein
MKHFSFLFFLITFSLQSCGQGKAQVPMTKWIMRVAHRVLIFRNRLRKPNNRLSAVKLTASAVIKHKPSTLPLAVRIVMQHRRLLSPNLQRGQRLPIGRLPNSTHRVIQILSLFNFNKDALR